MSGRVVSDIKTRAENELDVRYNTGTNVVNGCETLQFLCKIKKSKLKFMQFISHIQTPTRLSFGTTNQYPNFARYSRMLNLYSVKK